LLNLTVFSSVANSLENFVIPRMVEVNCPRKLSSLRKENTPHSRETSEHAPSRVPAWLCPGYRKHNGQSRHISPTLAVRQCRGNIANAAVARVYGRCRALKQSSIAGRSLSLCTTAANVLAQMASSHGGGNRCLVLCKGKARADARQEINSTAHSDRVRLITSCC
jgi:hypothetical protein